MEIIESDILTTNGHEVWVKVEDGGEVAVFAVDRTGHDGPAAIGLMTLSADAAHELGNKLRLAAKKIASR
jgi:hypothetical protein